MAPAGNQFGTIWLLLLMGAIPIWCYLIVLIPQGTGWAASPLRGIITPLVLIVMTIAIRRMLSHRYAWPLAALLSGVLILTSLHLAAWFS